MANLFVVPLIFKPLLPNNSIFVNNHQKHSKLIEIISKTKHDNLYTNIKLPDNIKASREFKGLNPLLIAYLRDKLNPIFISNASAKIFDTFKDRDDYIFKSDSRWFVDVSDLGKGKTHNSAAINPKHYGYNRIVFLKNKKFDRNTETLEGFVPFPARHKGLIKDGITSFDGTSSFRRARKDEIPDIEANCINPIMPCNLCAIKSSCTKGTNALGYNARFEIANAKEYTRILAHPLSIQPIDLKPSDIVIIDEASALLELTETTQFDNDMKAKIDYLSITGKFNLPFSESDIDTWGFENIKEKCREQLAFSDYNLTIDELVEDPKDIDGDILSVLKFINIIGHDKAIYDPESKSVVAPNDGLITALDKAGKVIMLDATCNVAIFRLFGINVEAVKVGEFNAPMCIGNLTIDCLENLPKINNRSSEQEKQEILKVRNELKKKHKNIGFVSPKIIAQEGDIVTFVNSRGSNLLENRNTVVCLATPTINLGAARIEFNALFYPLSFENAPHLFNEYYSSLNDAELLQIIGRTRFTRRENEKLDFKIVTEAWKLNWVTSLGFKLNNPNKPKISFNLFAKK